MPTLFFLGLTLMDAISRVSQMTLMAVICSAAVAFVADLWKAQYEQARNTTARLELAMADVIEQRRLTRTIVNGVDVGLVALDAEGAYDSTNPRHEEFMAMAYPDGHRGMAGQEGFVYAADGVTLLTSAEMPTTMAVQGEAFRDYLIWVGEVPAERRALAVSSSPYFRNNGEFGGAVLAYHDITELVVASRIKEEFVASVSHELRTPLTSIIGYIDVILDDTENLPEDARAYLLVVQRNARRLHRLVDDLLSTALQSVATVLDVERVSVTELLERSAVEARKAATAAGLELDLDTTSGGAQARHQRRQRAPRAGLRQPVQQRDQVHPGRRSGRGQRRTRRRRRRGQGPRHRPWHRRVRAEQDLQQVLPRQRGAHRRDPRRRARTLDHQDDRGRPRRQHHGDQRARQGHHLRGPTAARGAPARPGRLIAPHR